MWLLLLGVDIDDSKDGGVAWRLYTDSFCRWSGVVIDETFTRTYACRSEVDSIGVRTMNNTFVINDQERLLKFIFTTDELSQMEHPQQQNIDL